MTIQEAIYIGLICGTFTFVLTVGSITLYEAHKGRKRLEETVKKIKETERKLKELRENDDRDHCNRCDFCGNDHGDRSRRGSPDIGQGVQARGARARHDQPQGSSEEI